MQKAANVFLIVLLSIQLINCKKDDDVLSGPGIDSFYPTSGTEGTVITIIGKNFSATVSENIVSIGTLRAEVTLASTSQLTIVAPANLKDGQIKVEVGGKLGISSGTFLTFPEPIISSITPASGPAGTEVTITGDFFSEKPSSNGVKLGLATPQIVSSTKTTIKFIVPDDSYSSSLIEVTVNGLKSVLNTTIKFRSIPVIKSFTPATGKAGSTIDIKGTGLINGAFSLKYVNGEFAELPKVSETATDWKVTVPTPFYELATSKLYWNELLGLTESSTNFIFIKSWNQKTDFPGTSRRYAASFSIGTKIYYGLGSAVNGNNLKDFWEYDTEANTWLQKADFAGAARFDAVTFALNGKGYVATGIGSAIYKDTWQYDPAINSWTQMADYGGGPVRGASSFASTEKAYIIYGNETWEYDPLTNAWTKKLDFPGSSRTNAAAFFLNGKGYYGSGFYTSAQTGPNEFWEYTPASNSWLKKLDCPIGGEFDRYIGFSIGSKGYIGKDKYIYQYDAQQNAWKQMEDINDSGGIVSNTGTSGNNKGYYFGSPNPSNTANSNHFWVFDPN